MSNISRTSNILVTILKALIVITPISIILRWGFIDSQFMQGLMESGMYCIESHHQNGFDQMAVQWSATSKPILILSEFVGEATFILSLVYLIFIFKNYGNGEIFTMNNAKHYRVLGILFFVNAFICKPLSGLLFTIGLTINDVMQKLLFH